MSQTENIGSGWDHMLTAIINSMKRKNQNSFDGFHELEAMQRILNIPEICQLTSDWISLLSEQSNVSVENSNSFRSIGNELYKSLKENGMKCVNFYTKAIFTAPKNSQELGMAFANRGAALMNLGCYEEAHSDCKLARQMNYPQSKLVKVLWRQARCAIELENLGRLTSDLTELNRLLDELKIQHIHGDLIQKLTSKQKELQDKISTSSVDCISGSKEVDKKVIEQTNSQKGRFVIAAEKIQTDELIVTEKAFAFIPVAQKFEQDPVDLHCQNCAATNIIPYPCNHCKRASYCGPSCIREHEEIHQFECSGYQKHLWFEVGISHLALRTMLGGINGLVNRISHLRDATPLSAWKEMLLTLNDSDFRYGHVLRLVTNFDKTESDDFLGYVLTAVMITMYLKKHTTFFQKLDQKFPRIMSIPSWEVFIGAIIARHIGQLICNGHAISDFEINTDSFTSPDCIAKGKLSMSIESKRIFTAIFPRISMFNHSCKPNIRNRFNKTDLMIYARRTVNVGDEILNCYGPNNKLDPYEERQEMLKQQYHFQCDCSACLRPDDDYLITHTYLCPCGADMVILGKEKFWWRDCTNDSPPKAVRCCSCSRQLKFDWLMDFRIAVEQLEYAFDDAPEETIERALLNAIAAYENSAKYMKGDANSQQLDMSNMIIKYVVQYLNRPSFRLTKQIDKNFNRIESICRSSLFGLEYKFGRSLEYISALASLMDIIAIFGRFGENVVQEKDFSCLSDRTAKIFKNYFDEMCTRPQ